MKEHSRGEGKRGERNREGARRDEYKYRFNVCCHSNTNVHVRVPGTYLLLQLVDDEISLEDQPREKHQHQ